MGVPHFDFNGALGISGAVPPAVLLQSMRRALALSQ
jgi:predicted DsbA family dithiol-disulfide isomerase